MTEGEWIDKVWLTLGNYQTVLKDFYFYFSIGKLDTPSFNFQSNNLIPKDNFPNYISKRIFSQFTNLN